MHRIVRRESLLLINIYSRLNQIRQFGFVSSTISSAPRRRAGWSGLGAFATSDEANAAWKRLKSVEDEVESTIERYLHPRQRLTEMDWGYWEKSIKHKPIVDCLKEAYIQQIDIANKALSELEVEAEEEEEEVGWDLFDHAVSSCEKAVVASEELVADGARALWVSHRNPPAWTISPDEWIDSDLWWQAYIERHHHFDPTKDTESYKPETFEEDNEDESIRREWRRKTDLFHDRSDTPTLYQYMDQLHSSDYYDIYRRVFLEHMLYFLIRTGNSHHFFPEIPPTEWVVDLEKLRFRWLSAAHARRKARQLTSCSREEPLDLCPVDSDIEHHGEEHYLKLLNKERLTWELLVGRLMADFCFLCYPSVPCTSSVSLYRAIATDAGCGKLYSLGSDVASLFYVPEGYSRPFHNNDESPTCPPSPMECLALWLSHLTSSGASINPGYEDILKIHAELLAKRGEYWFTSPCESVREGFMRRLQPDNPSRKVYEWYLQELKERWNNAVEISITNGFEKISQIEVEAKDTDAAFRIFQDSAESVGVQKCVEEILNSQLTGKLDNLLRSKKLFVIEKGQQVDEASFGTKLSEINNARLRTIEAINAIKLIQL